MLLSGDVCVTCWHTHQRALGAVGADAPLFATSLRDPQRHLTWLSVSISSGSNKSSKSTDTDAVTITMRSLSNLPVTLTTPCLPARVCDHPDSEWGCLCDYITEISCKNKSSCLQTRWHFAELGMFGKSLLPACGRLSSTRQTAASLWTRTTNKATPQNANSWFSICWCSVCVCVWEPVYRGTRAPGEGHSCLVVGHRWLRRRLLPTMTLPLLSPSPSSYFMSLWNIFLL